MNTIFERINLEDISQIVIGAAVMAIPIAFSEELWKFGETLPAFNIFLLVAISLIIQFFYTYFSLFQGKEKRYSHIFFRVVLNYVLTFVTVALILFVLNRLHFDFDFMVGFKRILILCFPASLGAVIVDGLDKEY
jgi:uncharacterized membrane protein